MANFLDTDPQLAESIEHHRLLGKFVPVALHGDLLALVSHRHIGAYPPATPLPVEDYVTGLELLGFKFYTVSDGPGQGLYVMDPSHHIPDAWYRRSLDIMLAYGHRTSETIDFLLERDGVPLRVAEGTLPKATSLQERIGRTAPE